MRNYARMSILSAALAAAFGASALSFAADAKKEPPKPPTAKAAAAPAPAAVFELYKDTAGEFRFRFRDEDGTLLASSGKGYKTKSDCQKAIDAIKRSAARAGVDDQAK